MLEIVGQGGMSKPPHRPMCRYGGAVLPQVFFGTQADFERAGKQDGNKETTEGLTLESE